MVASRQNSDGKVINLPTQGRTKTSYGLSDHSNSLTSECKRLTEARLNKMLQSLLEGLDDSLFNLAEKADSHKQNDYFHAMREMRKLGSGLAHRVSRQVLAQFDQFIQQGPNAKQFIPQSQLSDELSLVEESSFEEELAITTMSKRTEKQHSQELSALADRFGLIIQQKELEAKELPVAPRVICQAIADPISELGMELDTRLVIYKLFEKGIATQLGKLYGDLNNLLSQNGVLPKLPKKGIRNPNRSSSGSRRAPDKEGQSEGKLKTREDEDTADTEAEAEALQLFDTLRQLVAQHPLIAASATASSAATAALPAAPTGEVLSALSQIQHLPPATTASSLSPDELKALLLQQHAIGQGEKAQQHLDRNDEEMINVVALLFDYILDDPALSDHIKVLLGRLQIPLLKVALIDRSLFGKKNHPARRLLNNLAKAAVRLDDGAVSNEDPLYLMIESTVETILKEFEDNLDIFTTLLEDFAAFLNQEEAKAEAIERRESKANEGRERLRAARRLAKESLRYLLERHPRMADVTRTLMAGPWKDVLSTACLRHGPESDEWHQDLDLIERIIWSTEPKSSTEDRQRLLSDIPILIRSLKDMLDRIAFDSEKSRIIFQALQQAHIACLRNKAPQTTTRLLFDEPDSELEEDTEISIFTPTLSSPVSTDMETDAEETELSPDEETIDNSQDDAWQLAETAEIGTWFEYKFGGDALLRVKLSWRSGISDLCVFVNRKGMKVAELRVPEIAEGIRRGDLRVVEEAASPFLVDRAMNALVKSLKQRVA